MAELRGRTKMAMATLTSLEMGRPLLARMPSRPMGNQQRKSVMATVIRRRANVTSLLEVLLVVSVRMEACCTDQKMVTCPTAMKRNSTKLKMMSKAKE